jgi:hypothetical protein
MELLAVAIALIAGTFAFTFLVRGKDIPQVDSVPPVRHLEERRAAIYENLRDLQFEYRVGKLSDADYQQTKVGLQRELAGVMAEMERVGGGDATPRSALSTVAKVVEHACPHCGAQFAEAMKFCGECGKGMA